MTKKKPEIKPSNYYEEIIEKIKTSLKNDENEKALDILVEEMSMPYIPTKYEEEFSKLFREVSLIIENVEMDTKYNKVLNDEEIIAAFSRKEIEPLHVEIAINSLKKVNIRNLMNDLQKVLLNKEISDFLKTLILLEMVEQKIDIEVSIFKTGKKISLTPKDLNPLQETKSFSYISRILENELFTDQTQLTISFGIMQTHLIFIYPEEIETKDWDMLACCTHYMSSIFLRKEEALEAVMNTYKIPQDQESEVLDLLDEMQMILDEKEIS